MTKQRWTRSQCCYYNFWISVKYVEMHFNSNCHGTLRLMS